MLKCNNLKYINILFKNYFIEKNFSKINIKTIKIFIIIIIFFLKIKIKYRQSLARYKHYTNDCRNLKKYSRIRINKNVPYFSICLPTFNMENYIEKVVISILNQSFQDFEIIIVNDNSNDNTEIITKSIMFKDQRIKIIKHSETLGVYASRVDAILASRGKYILLMDPDDMLLNPNLFLELYYYNLKNNLDIIEFTVFCFEEKNSELIIKDSRYHYHNLEGIIYQPELSNIFFYDSTTKNYSYVQCRNIWNKILRRELVLKTINYIGKDYYKKFFITAEDTIINLISLNFAKNYTNIKLPGYMYNIREISMTHGNFDERKQILFSYNHLLYLKKLYKYIKEFNKDRNFLYYEMQFINILLIKLQNLTNIYNLELEEFYQEILSDNCSSKIFKDFIINLQIY